MGLSPKHLEPLWLLNVCLLLYKTIQKHYLHIHLMDLPTHPCCNGHNTLDGNISQNRCECLIIVNPLNMRESVKRSLRL